MNLLIPKMYQKDVYSIDYDKLIKLGYKVIIFDLDNTIGKVKDDTCEKEMVDFINNLNKKIKVVIASNSLKKRVQYFCRELECDVIAFSLKPSLIALRKIKKEYNIEYNKMVIVGDQLLTDILVGNRKNLLTILVDKKGRKDFKITKFNRYFEDKIRKKYKIKKGEYY